MNEVMEVWRYIYGYVRLLLAILSMAALYLFFFVVFAIPAAIVRWILKRLFDDKK